MKEFKVTFEKNIEVEDLENAIVVSYNLSGVTISELQAQSLTVPMERTGVLKSPAEICGCESVPYIPYVTKFGDHLRLTKANLNLGQRLSIENSAFPIEFYKDVEESIDWDAIKPGDLVEVDYDDRKRCGYYRCDEHGKYLMPSNAQLEQSRKCIFINEIKSIRIVERAINV